MLVRQAGNASEMMLLGETAGLQRQGVETVLDLSGASVPCGYWSVEGMLTRPASKKGHRISWPDVCLFGSCFFLCWMYFCQAFCVLLGNHGDLKIYWVLTHWSRIVMPRRSSFKATKLVAVKVQIWTVFSVFWEKVVTYSALTHKIIGEVLSCSLGEQREKSKLWNQETRSRSFMTVRIMDSGPDWASQVQHNSKVPQLPSSRLVHLSVSCHMRRVGYLSHIVVRIHWNRACNMCVCRKSPHNPVVPVTNILPCYLD